MEWLKDLINNHNEKTNADAEKRKAAIENSLKKEKEVRLINQKALKEIVLPTLREIRKTLQQKNIEHKLEDEKDTLAEEGSRVFKSITLKLKPSKIDFQSLFFEVSPNKNKKELLITYMANNRVGPKNVSLSSEDLSKELFEVKLKQFFSQIFSS